MTDWKKRALDAEAKAADLAMAMQLAVDKALEVAEGELERIQQTVNDMPLLMSLARDGRKVRFIFMRRGETTMIETYGSIDMPVEQWKAKLLDDAE